MSGSNRQPHSDEHYRLGQALRAYRTAAGVTTRGIPEYSSGHISNVENGHVTPSREFIELYALRFGGEHGRLLDEFARLKSTTEQRRRAHRISTKPSMSDPPAITESSDSSVIRSAYQVRDYEIVYRLDAKGVIRETHAIRRIQAIYPGVSLASAMFNYPADTNPDAITLHAGTGCELARSESSTRGYLTAVLRLPRELHPSDDHPHSLSYSIKNTSQIAAHPVISYYGRPSVGRYAVRLCFTEPTLPGRVWRFRGSEPSIADATPRPEQYLEHSPAGFYHWDFHNLDREHVGLAWSWG